MLVFILLSHFFSFNHDFAMANFQISQEKEGLVLNIKMDKENLENIYRNKEGKKNETTIGDDFIQKYLDEHFILMVNDKKVNFHLQGVSTNKYFYKIEFSSLNKFKEIIHKVQLKNTCLIDDVDNHSNLVNFKFNGKERTFRLHESRVRIDLEY